MVHAKVEAAPLVTLALRRNEGTLSADGAFCVRTGIHTGRSVLDKFVVDEPETSADIWWGKVNQKLLPESFARLSDQVRAICRGRRSSRRTSMPAPRPPIASACASSRQTRGTRSSPATSSSGRRPRTSMVSSPTM